MCIDEKKKLTGSEKNNKKCIGKMHDENAVTCTSSTYVVVNCENE